MLLALKIMCLMIWVLIVFFLVIASESGRFLKRRSLISRQVLKRSTKRKTYAPNKTTP